MECKYLTFNLKQKFSASSSAIAEPITLQELIEIFFGKKKKNQPLVLYRGKNFHRTGSYIHALFDLASYCN